MKGIMENVSDEELLTYYFHDMEYRSLIIDQKSLEHKTLVRCNVVRDLDVRHKFCAIRDDILYRNQFHLTSG